jgi:hypothetical protein
MKYIMDIEKFYEKLFLISKYCPISNNNGNTVVPDMNNIESSIDPKNYDLSSTLIYN